MPPGHQKATTKQGRLLHDHQKISNTIESSTHTCSATHENTFTIKPLARESRPWSRHDSRHDSTVRSPHTTTSRGAASHVEGGLHLSLTLDLALPLHSSGRDSPTNKERARTQTQRRSHRTACPPDRADHTYRQARGGRRGRVRLRPPNARMPSPPPPPPPPPLPPPLLSPYLPPAKRGYHTMLREAPLRLSAREGCPSPNPHTDTLWCLVCLCALTRGMLASHPWAASAPRPTTPSPRHYPGAPACGGRCAATRSCRARPRSCATRCTRPRRAPMARW